MEKLSEVRCVYGNELAYQIGTHCSHIPGQDATPVVSNQNALGRSRFGRKKVTDHIDQIIRQLVR